MAESSLRPTGDPPHLLCVHLAEPPGLKRPPHLRRAFGRAQPRQKHPYRPPAGAGAVPRRTQPRSGLLSAAAGSPRAASVSHRPRPRPLPAFEAGNRGRVSADGRNGARPRRQGEAARGRCRPALRRTAPVPAPAESCLWRSPGAAGEAELWRGRRSLRSEGKGDWSEPRCAVSAGQAPPRPGCAAVLLGEVFLGARLWSPLF